MVCIGSVWEASEWKVVCCVRNIEEKFEKATTFIKEHVSRCFGNSSPGFSMTKEQLKEVLVVRVDEYTVWPNANILSDGRENEVIVFGFTRCLLNPLLLPFHLDLILFQLERMLKTKNDVKRGCIG